MSKNLQPEKGANDWIMNLIAKVVLVVIALVAMVNYFQPAQKKSNILMQTDILQGKGMSKEIADYRKANDDAEPLWTGRMFGGMPAYQISTYYENDVLLGIDNFLKMRWAFGHPIGQMFVLFLGMFFLLSMLKMDPFTAAVGSFAFLLSSYFFIAMEAGHNSKINAMSYVPAVLAGILVLYRGKYLLGGALTALFLALELNANHLQMTFYMFFIVGCIVVAYYAKSVSILGKVLLFVGLFVMLLSWMLNLPPIVGLIAAAIAILGPILYELMTGMSAIDGDKIGKLFKGKDLPGKLPAVRHFVIASAIMGAASMFAVGPNVARLWTTSEYAAESIRGKQVLTNPTENQVNEEGLSIDYAFQWSYGVGETFTIINADYFGGASGHDIGQDSRTYDILTRAVGKQGAESLTKSWPTYIGDVPFTSGPVYIGIVIFFLFILGLVVVPDNSRWWLLAATLIGFMLAWGRNFMIFNEAMFYNFPIFDRFRAVSMALVISQTTIPILGALGLYHFYKRSQTEDRKAMVQKLGIAAGITAAFLLIMLVFTPGIDTFAMNSDGARISSILRRAGLQNPDPSLVNQLVSALPSDRQALMTAGVMRGFLFLLLGGGVLAGYLYFLKDAFKGKQARYGSYAVSIVLMIMVVADLWPIDRQYLNEDNFVKKTQYERPLQPTQADQAIFQDTDPNFRVLNLMRDPWNDATTSYHHKTIGGYHPAKLRRYNDLITFHLDREINGVIQQFQSQEGDPMQNVQAALASSPVLNMMNLKYIIYNGAAPPAGNNSRLGHAWFVNKYEVLATPDEAIARLGSINPAETAILEKADSEKIQGMNLTRDPSASITLLSYQPNHLTYESNVSGAAEQLAVFSEVYYNSGKGWQAYIDGNEADHFRVDYVLRAMRIPSGKHTIEFKFEPRSYTTGSRISFIFGVLLLLVVAGSVFLDYRKSSSGEEGENA